jgi:hypothetical protein
MKFICNGDLETFMEKFQAKAVMGGKGYLCNRDQPDTVSIEIQRLGYCGGRWFEATVKQEKETVILEGEIKNINGKPLGKFVDFMLTVGMYLVVYWILLGMLLLIWKMAGIDFFIIPILLPLVFLMLLRIQGTKEEKKTDQAFMQFMTKTMGCQHIEL